MSKIEVSKLVDVFRWSSLGGYIDVIKFDALDYVLVDAVSRGRTVGVYSIFSKSYFPLDRTFSVSSVAVIKVMRTLFRNVKMVEFSVDDDVIISGSGTVYRIRQRTDVPKQNDVKPNISLGMMPDYGYQIVGEYSIPIDVLSTIKPDEDSVRFIGTQEGLKLKFSYLGGDTVKTYRGQTNESYDIFIDYRELSRILDSLDGEVVFRVLKNKYYRLQVAQYTEDYVLNYLLVETSG